MIYEHFVIRLHNESWTGDWIALAGKSFNEGELCDYVVGDVIIPNPSPKTESEDVPGTNGIFDYTEALGRVCYQNRQIVVPLIHREDVEWLWGEDGDNELFARLNGRLCDFSFEAYDNVEWVYTGRLSVLINRFKNLVTLTFDAWPFARKAQTTFKQIENVQNAESDASFWTYAEATDTIIADNGAGSFHINAGSVGTEIIYKHDNLTANQVYMIGIKSILGGSFQFIEGTGQNGRNDSAVGTVTSLGTLSAKIIVDGSYYEWKTINGVLTAFPSFYCEYFLVPVSLQSSAVWLPGNATIRPLVIFGDARRVGLGQSNGWLLADGVAYNLDEYGKTSYLRGLVLPGDRVDREITAQSVFACVGRSTSASVARVVISYNEQEAF